jgi:AraC-like DNA-binding protein
MAIVRLAGMKPITRTCLSRTEAEEWAAETEQRLRAIQPKRERTADERVEKLLRRYRSPATQNALDTTKSDPREFIPTELALILIYGKVRLTIADIAQQLNLPYSTVKRGLADETIKIPVSGTPPTARIAAVASYLDSIDTPHAHTKPVGRRR